MINVQNYQLDLKKVFNLNKNKRTIIIELYNNMINNYEGKMAIVGESIFNSLFGSGYLIDIRDKKINDIVDDDPITK